MQPPDLTPVHLFTLIASAIFGPAVAAVLGPYVAITIGAVGGAGVMVLHRDDEGNLRAFAYFLAAILFALMITVPAAKGLASLWQPLNENWLYAPVAALLAYSADKWTARIIPWGVGKVNSLVDAWIASRGKQ